MRGLLEGQPLRKRKVKETSGVETGDPVPGGLKALLRICETRGKLMVRVAIVGCGKIADQHADQVIHTPGCEIVGVCDREELMAQQLQERLKVPFGCTDLRDLLEHARPDVVHITTPPQTHYALGKLCLEAGCHIYVEKPFTTDLCEAEELISVAIRENRKVTVGHNAQFSH